MKIFCDEIKLASVEGEQKIYVVERLERRVEWDD